jgi:hypothetical protein
MDLSYFIQKKKKKRYVAVGVALCVDGSVALGRFASHLLTGRMEWR